jgi:flagellar assembly protein FliH
MAEFKKTDYRVKTETSGKERKINELNSDTVPVIRDFEFTSVHGADKGNYQAIKAKYGPLAATDAERNVRAVKDRRFSLNPLLRDPLSVEEEERRVIEEKVRARVETLAEEAKKAAITQGYEEGLKRGFDEAYLKVQNDSAGSLVKFDQLVEEAEKAKIEIFRANERFLVELVFRIARMVLLRELKADPEYIARLAVELVTRIGVKDNIKIKLNTEDAETISKLKGGLEKAFGKMNNLNIEVSPSVKQGGCQVETEWNAIDASVETQLKGIYESLFGKETKEA